MSDPYHDWGNPAHDPLMFGQIKVGERCLLHPTATIGSEPFVYHQDTRPFRRKDCRAAVVIGDDVEVMHHANIDRGVERDTVVGDGTKVDRHVQVGHDSRIGKHCILAAGTIVGGYAVLEDEVYCGINVSIRNRIRIGRGARIGMGAVVLRDVPPGCIVVGNPARVLKLRYDTPWYEEWCGPADDPLRVPEKHMPFLRWNGEAWVI